MVKSKIKIGIQGGLGSTNERAAKFFAEKLGLEDFEILYLISSENVLLALQKSEIDYGTFAWKSSRGGLVAETQLAIQKYSYTKIDEQGFQLDHVLLCKSIPDKSKIINIYSHPQALKEHKDFLKTLFPLINFVEETDTAISAKKLNENKYPENSLVIAPLVCAEIYNLPIYLKDLPSNQGYITTIYLVKK